MTAQDEQLLAGRGVPDADRAVVAAGHDARPVVAERDAEHPSLVPHQPTVGRRVGVAGNRREKAPRRGPGGGHSEPPGEELHHTGAGLHGRHRQAYAGSIAHGERSFRIDFDFTRHVLVVETCDDERRDVALEPRTTADFHRAVTEALRELELPVAIHPRPNEVEPAIPFADDEAHASYDPDAAHRFWRVLLQADRVFTRFRAGFAGKTSPSHFFWGSFDLAVTRFSGRTAPPHPGGVPNLPLPVMREAYSHEVSSAGFWPGGESLPFPIFYSYAYPTPAGFQDARVRPAAAGWNADLGEFVLPYEAVRTADDPERALLEFLESTYRAAADAADWDRALEFEFPS